MTIEQALQQLETLRDEKRRAFSTKHGAGMRQFGVPMGDSRKLAKQIKVIHDLGLSLWNSDSSTPSGSPSSSINLSSCPRKS